MSLPLPLAALLLVASAPAALVVHELGHALAARLVGARVRRVHVGLFAGFVDAALEGRPARARAAFLLGGPAANALVASALAASVPLGAPAWLALPAGIQLALAALTLADDGRRAVAELRAPKVQAKPVEVRDDRARAR